MIAQAIFLTIDWDYPMVWFPASPLKNWKVLIHMWDDDAHTVCLRKETFFNIGGNDPQFDNFKLQ